MVAVLPTEDGRWRASDGDEYAAEGASPLEALEALGDVLRDAIVHALLVEAEAEIEAELEKY